MDASIPAALLSSLQDTAGFDESRFIAAQQSAPSISIRFNPHKELASAANWSHADLIAGSVPWCSDQGIYLKERPSFTLDPWLHAGAYYVQEASSQFLQQALQQTVDLSKSLRVLDLCAAPGGKSTLIQSLLSKDSVLVSNEVIRTRVPVLMENLIKWGSGNVVVTQNDPADFSSLTSCFDVVVVDAPCSGSGLFRKDPEALNIWNPELVEHCRLRQQRILKDVWPALRPGGVLIYSTCSFSREENEEMVDWIMKELDATSFKIKNNPEWNVVETQSSACGGSGYRFYPDRLKGEGFFLAAFKKSGEDVAYKTTSAQKQKQKILPLPKGKALDAMLDQVPVLKDWSSMLHQDRALFMHQSQLELLPALQANLYVRMAGLDAGSLVRDAWIPAHALAVSGLLDDAFPAVELDLENALNYLRRHPDFKLDEAQMGWILMKYRGLALGWVKLMGNRVNNYYPKDWRILHQ
jgi:16S rRNA C967 or C1407 C5-methylase (RsmB/RsmF family)/NOL1/NOP2/fmu family ribosome biogenesis protein